MCQTSALYHANNRSSYIDRRSVIQSELEEVRKKRLTKSWVQRHIVDDFQTSVSASKSNFTISLDAWQSRQKTLHEESKRRQKDAKLKLHNYKRGIEAWPSQSTQQLLPNTTKPSSPQDEKLKNKFSSEYNRHSMTKTSSNSNPNYSLLIDWQLQQRNMAKQERMRRSSAEKMLRQFKSNQEAIVCPCPRPKKNATRNKVERASSDKVDTQVVIEKISAKLDTNSNLPWKRNGFVRSLTRKYEHSSIYTVGYDDIDLDECLSHCTHDTVLMDSEDESFYDSCGFKDVISEPEIDSDDDSFYGSCDLDSTADEIDIAEDEIEKPCEQPHEVKCSKKEQILISFLQEMNFMNVPDGFENDDFLLEFEEIPTDGKNIFDCLFSWLKF